jgi:hypothetical protein
MLQPMIGKPDFLASGGPALLGLSSDRQFLSPGAPLPQRRRAPNGTGQRLNCGNSAPVNKFTGNLWTEIQG